MTSLARKQNKNKNEVQGDQQFSRNASFIESHHNPMGAASYLHHTEGNSQFAAVDKHSLIILNLDGKTKQRASDEEDDKEHAREGREDDEDKAASHPKLSLTKGIELIEKIMSSITRSSSLLNTGSATGKVRHQREFWTSVARCAEIQSIDYNFDTKSNDYTGTTALSSELALFHRRLFDIMRLHTSVTMNCGPEDAVRFYGDRVAYVVNGNTVSLNDAQRLALMQPLSLSSQL